MKRLVNIRLALVCALSAILGIFSFYEALFGDFLPLVLFAAALAVLAVVLACLKNKKWAICLVALVVFAAGFFSFWANYAARHEDDCLVQQCRLSGRVTDIKRNGVPSNVLYLENCVADGQKLSGRVKVYVYDGSAFQTGDLVDLDGTLRRVYAVHDGVDTFSVRNGVRFELSQITLLSQQSGKLTWAEAVRKYIFQTTSQYMPRNADVAYALLTGDRNAMDAEKTSAFANSGTAHLLAVSGLHIGFVVAIFGLVLSRFKLKPAVHLAILLGPLLFYAYICGFSPSVVRAVLMTVCVFVARMLFGRYDLLTSLSWAVLIILLSRPLLLFDLGFQLSAMSVFGIATIYLQADRFLRRHKLHKAVYWLLSTLAMSFSCVAATFFVVACHGGKVALLGIFVNVVAIPLVFVAFALCVFGLVPWVFHYLLWLADWVVEAVVVLAKAVASLNALLPVTAAAIAVVVSAVLLFVLGGYVNLGRCGKTVCYSVCACLLAVCIAASMLPRPCKNSVSVFIGYNDTVIVATSADGEAAVIGEFSDSYVADKAISHLDARGERSTTLYVTSFKRTSQDVISSVLNSTNVTQIYLLDTSGNDAVWAFFAAQNLPVSRLYLGETGGQNVRVNALYNAGLSAVVVRVGKLSVADILADGGASRAQFEALPDVDYFVCRQNADISAAPAPVLTQFWQQDNGNFGLNKYGNFTITEKDATIVLNFRRNQP